jgi:hypothetical protein
VREEIVAYPRPGSNVAEGMPVIPGPGDCELRRQTRAKQTASAIHLQRGDKSFLRDVDLAELPLAPYLLAKVALSAESLIQYPNHSPLRRSMRCKKRCIGTNATVEEVAMMVDPDLSKVATDVTTGLLKELAGSFLERAKSLTGDQVNRLRVSWKAGFGEYIRQTVDRAGRVKTILYRDRSVPITQMYVETNFKLQGKEISEERFFERLSKVKRAIVSGSAGSGKSIFMKHSTLRISQRHEGRKIPIFVELRHINHFGNSIMHYALEQIVKPAVPSFDQNALDYSLKSGLFVLILDGFDEVNFDNRQRYLQELAFMADRYRDLEIIVSTRPEESTLALDGFDVYHVSPLSKELAIELIEQIEYEEDLKANFISSLRERIYSNYLEFASNPLLLTMLLLTYDQVRDVPHKMHIFFNQAFEALFFKHDRLKALYQRKTYSEIDIEEMKKLYSWFCAVSYFNNEYSFNEQQCDDLLRDAMKFCGINADLSGVKSDLISSYSMLKRDGLFITFVHRAFQEYFCAYFLSRSDEVDLYKVIDDLAGRGRTEQCLRMLFDIAPERITLRWMLPFLEGLGSACARFRSEKNFAGFINHFYFGGSVTKENVMRLGRRKPDLDKMQLCAELLASQMTTDDFEIQALVSREILLDARKVDQFFGGRTPFDGQNVELRVEDNKWLANEKLEEFVDATQEFLQGAASHLTEIAEARRTKTALFSRGPIVSSPVRYTAQFSARGEPQIVIDQRTGERKSVPSVREIKREIIEPPE